MIIDARMQAALARLTDNEKECLRRRLQQQTAKEMALDLGISPHAAEKRLKMARTKLGLSSSLEAARLLEASEEDQPTAPQASDLAPSPAPADKPASRATIIGMLAMSLVLTTAAALLLIQPIAEGAMSSAEPSTAPLPAPEDRTPDADGSIKFGMGDLANVEATPQRAHRYVRQMFDQEDVDGSGHIELAEAPTRLEVAEPRPPGSSPLPYSEAKIVEVMEGDAARAEYIRHSDLDGDGRISFDEYAVLRVHYYELHGIPLIPADWTTPPAGG